MENQTPPKEEKGLDVPSLHQPLLFKDPPVRHSNEKDGTKIRRPSPPEYEKHP